MMIQLHKVEDSGPLTGSGSAECSSDQETLGADSVDKTGAYEISLC